ncbi:MmcQ/YjbR family DNA-binding protein [Levilactobacillus enshiensis]|uniref:MmcQ/YjbR family DNA-binding protein n=1 Tax=Levilactobacillus enshiensis TaxID=2590213 RepID=UPI00131D3250|nr:MmcQ/YjbR family DNA-binding protein [Levilactobacillus enshiensis]
MKITRAELIAFSSAGKAVTIDQPFNNPAHRNQVIFDALRHQASRKIFGLVYEKGDNLYIDLKCDPARIDELVDAFSYILPGQHFTKQNWLTLAVDQVPSREILANLVNASYHLTE